MQKLKKFNKYKYAKTSCFLRKDIQKYIRGFPDGNSKNQINHCFVKEDILKIKISGHTGKLNHWGTQPKNMKRNNS